MQPIRELPRDVANDLRGVFTDIDGTLTQDGKLSAEAYLALWRLKAAGLLVVPVTGRPAGWCDLIARQWPVDAVVGENGAFAFWEADRHLDCLFHPEVVETDVRDQLDEVRKAILAEVPGSRVSKDQPYRMFDLAIDFREEPPDLGLDAAEVIRAIFERHGAHAKISNIHVNGWFGDYDKLSMVEVVAQEVLRIDLAREKERYLFCGDSPNDEPMFEYFPNACGVANIEQFADKLDHLPRFLSTRDGGAGFAEIVDQLLERRDQNA